MAARPSLQQQQQSPGGGMLPAPMAPPTFKDPASVQGIFWLKEAQV